MTCKLFRTRPVETKCIVVFEIKQYSLSSSSFINLFFCFFLIMSDTIIIHSNGASFKHERAFGRCSFHPKIVVELFLFANLEHIEVFFFFYFNFLFSKYKSQKRVYVPWPFVFPNTVYHFKNTKGNEVFY